jgi:hypothetical protein
MHAIDVVLGNIGDSDSALPLFSGVFGCGEEHKIPTRDTYL